MIQDRRKKEEATLKSKNKNTGLSEDDKKLDKDDVVVVDSEISRKNVVATGVGNAMEWFDFGIYSYSATTIGMVFFPEMSGPVQLVYTFTAFAAAFLIRPIGGMFFGSLGDKIGRKKTLAITLIVMALATLSIGLIPGYNSIGIAAPILLMVARLVQGFSTGGEYSGAMTFLSESTPDKKRGSITSGLEVGTLIGYIAGSGVVTLLTFLLSSEAMTSWGWRIPFIIAAPIGLIGFYLRSRLEESPAFEAMKSQKSEENKKVSTKDLLTKHWKVLIIALLVIFFYNIVNYTVLTYMPSHLNSVLDFGESKGLLVILIVMVLMVPLVLVMGSLGDRFGNKKVILSGLITLILLSYPAFALMDTGNFWFAFIGVMIIAVSLTTFQGTMPSLLPSLFFTSVRYRGLSITYNLSTAIFGGTAPALISWMVSKTGSSMAPSYYIIFASIIGFFVMTFLVKDTSGKSLRGSAPTVENKQEKQDVVDEPEEALWWKDEQTEETPEESHP